MRVTTGLYKGRTIDTVKDRSVRPATDRVRQAIFNVLANRLLLKGSAVLDLFAGSGSLGIEALSRGAIHAVFVEDDRHAASCIEKNVRKLGCEAVTEIVVMDARAYIDSARKTFDLVFADPPYAYGYTELLPSLVFGGGLVHGRGFLVIEHAADRAFAGTSRYSVGPVKRFGRTCVSFFSILR
jgi:16S rRNA (guanine966-N2)-methyltransferase